MSTKVIFTGAAVGIATNLGILEYAHRRLEPHFNKNEVLTPVILVGAGGGALGGLISSLYFGPDASVLWTVCVSVGTLLLYEVAMRRM